MENKEKPSKNSMTPRYENNDVSWTFLMNYTDDNNNRQDIYFCGNFSFVNTKFQAVIVRFGDNPHQYMFWSKEFIEGLHPQTKQGGHAEAFCMGLEEAEKRGLVKNE